MSQNGTALAKLLANFDAQLFTPPSDIIRTDGVPLYHLDEATSYSTESADSAKIGTLFVFDKGVQSALIKAKQWTQFARACDLLTFLAVRAIWGKIQDWQQQNAVHTISNAHLLLAPNTAEGVIGTALAKEMVRSRYKKLGELNHNEYTREQDRYLERLMVAHLIVGCTYSAEVVSRLREFKYLAAALGRKCDGDPAHLSYMEKPDE